MTQGRRLLIYVILGALILLYITSMPRGGKKRTAIPPGPPQVSRYSSLPPLVQAPLPAQDPEGVRRMMREAASRTWGRDPFLLQQEGVRPVATVEDGSIANLRLYGTIWTGDTTCAVINDWVVKEGDRIAGATVKRIGRDQLVLEREGRQHILRIQE